MTHGIDDEMMHRCLVLAERGRLNVTPNPMVGCVVVKRGKIVGEGYHKRFGGHHAEVYALRQAGMSANGATLYVSLEPCAHVGKTPPCVNAIIAAGVKRVVAATHDPNAIVSGKGIRMLRASGIDVQVGVLRKEAEKLNEKYIVAMKSRRPYVGLKIAQTLDGKIADLHRNSKWITGEESQRYVHQLRAAYEAVLVGAGTVVKDDPDLTVRLVQGRAPTRIVIDGSLRIPIGARMFRTNGGRTLVLTRAASLERKRRHVLRLEANGIQVFGVRTSAPLSAGIIRQVLGMLGITSVLVEGGSRIFSRFLDEGIADRIHYFIAAKMFGRGLSSFESKTGRTVGSPIVLDDTSVRRLGTDIYVEGRPVDNKSGKRR
ncbi:MAG: bifunctional diaminohydroxyphosphoribosylaminopyrimidine deaminase/5-amino-6-(5-phosphoribosylamino)uracil reductase RibD [Ignavibacteria bacterium]|nr:bifunctional diaminohydroxyphosphoribosylaminopyrimidine deaminase/5-amino-6-(5-phosphoribosylamino)uracil reductase RibD [Ignavibacteria bacterium]